MVVFLKDADRLKAYRENLVLQYENIMFLENNREYHQGLTGFRYFISCFNKGWLELHEKKKIEEIDSTNISLKKEIINAKGNVKWQKEMNDKEFEGFINGKHHFNQLIKL